jgi:hypothetical protein
MLHQPALSIFRSKGTRRAIGLLSQILSISICWAANAQLHGPPVRPISLEESVVIALTNNRALQIERLNPEIARLTLSESYGYYDPILSSTAHAEDTTDPGGLQRGGQEFAEL